MDHIDRSPQYTLNESSCLAIVCERKGLFTQCYSFTIGYW